MAVIPHLSLSRKGGILQVKQRLAQSEITRITCADDIRRFLLPLTTCEAFECTWAVYLDRHKHVIAFSKVAIGDTRGTYMSPELFVRQGMMLIDIAGIITAHNHVWDPALPSDEDLESFALLRKAFELFEWDYEDNVILSPNEFYSFKSRGHYAPPSRRVPRASNTIRTR